MLVHQRQPLVVQFEQPPLKLGPGHVRVSAARVQRRLRHREVLFEADLALHEIQLNPSLNNLIALVRPILQPVVLADRGIVEPDRGVIDVLERPVGREHDAVGADLEDGVDQRLGAEVARRRDVEVLREIIGDPALGRITMPVLDPGVAVVDPPHAERQSLAHVAEHDRKLRVRVEQARSHQPQRMHRGLLAEGPGRPKQPLRAFIDAGIGFERIARVQIERHVELLHHRPERPVLRQVVVDDGVGIADLREAVDQHALEAEVAHAAVKLADRQIGILHRQGGEALEAAGPLLDLAREIVVGFAGHVIRARRVGDRLHHRRVEREQHHLDAVLVHQPQPVVVQIEQPRLQLAPDAVRKEAARIVQRLGNCEMLFKPDLAPHDPPHSHLLDGRYQDADGANKQGCRVSAQSTAASGRLTASSGLRSAGTA